MNWTSREGVALTQLREAQGRSQRYCARKAKVSPSTWGNWEKGTHEPSAGAIFFIETELFQVGQGYFERLRHREAPTLRVVSPAPLRPFTQMEIKELLDLVSEASEELKVRLTRHEANKKTKSETVSE